MKTNFEAPTLDTNPNGIELNYQDNIGFDDIDATFIENVDEWENILIENSLKEIDHNQIGVTMDFDTYQTNVNKYLDESLASIPSEEQSVRADLATIVPTKGSFLDRLSVVESGHTGYGTKPNKHGYEGKYQHRFRKGDDGYKFMKQLGFSEKEINNEVIRRNPSVQEAIMTKAVEEYAKDLESNNIKVTNRTLWYRHNQGMGGARAITRGKLTRKIRYNIKNQFSAKEQERLSWSSDAEYISNYKAKFDLMF